MSQQGWRPRRFDRRRLVPALLGVLAGCTLASVMVGLGSSAVAQRAHSEAGAVFDATHLPALLRLPGERPRLVYDVHCVPEGVDDPERGCDVDGTVFFREDSREAFRAQKLQPSSSFGMRQLTATVPLDVASDTDGFEYYAELRTGGRAAPILLPAGGAHAPHRSLPLPNASTVELGSHVFGNADPGERVVFTRWGDGPRDVGLEPGRSLPAIGASAFDVTDDGKVVVLLDEAHRRALRFEGHEPAPTSVSLAIDGRLADLATDTDGSMYVLESVAAPGRTPLVRWFDRAGRELGVVETAERTPAEIRSGSDGPVVLQHPSHQWMPVADGGALSPPRAQARKAAVGRPVGAGRQVVVLRRGAGEILAAILAGGRVQRSWRIRSDTPLGDVQLAEPAGNRLVIVSRVFTHATDEFTVLVLDGHRLGRQFSTPSDEWAEAAPLGRFRLVGHDLYRLGSNASGAFVARYDLEMP
jgi:hypothetical protein